MPIFVEIVELCSLGISSFLCTRSGQLVVPTILMDNYGKCLPVTVTVDSRVHLLSLYVLCMNFCNKVSNTEIKIVLCFQLRASLAVHRPMVIQLFTWSIQLSECAILTGYKY